MWTCNLKSQSRHLIEYYVPLIFCLSVSVLLSSNKYYLIYVVEVLPKALIKEDYKPGIDCVLSGEFLNCYKFSHQDFSTCITCLAVKKSLFYPNEKYWIKLKILIVVLESIRAWFLLLFLRNPYGLELCQSKSHTHI